LFKKNITCSENEEDDDYEYIGNEKNEVKSITSSTSSASIKNHSSSGLTIGDKKVL